MYELLDDDLKKPLRYPESFARLRLGPLAVRGCAIGGSGKGKTQMAWNIVTRMGCFQRYIWILKKPDEDLIVQWRRNVEEQCGRILKSS